MFQEDRVADADRLLRTVVRKNPTYAGKPRSPVLEGKAKEACASLGINV